MVRDNAELTEHLKAMQEMARHSTDLAEDLKAAQAQIARDNVNFTEMLKASQEQIARLAASEQRQRPKTLASSPLPIPSTARKPVPTPPQVRLQTQYPTHLQPKQQ